MKSEKKDGINKMGLEVRRNDDGTVDEIVGEGHFHLEQMGDNEWCLILEKIVVHLTSDKEVNLIEVE